MQPRITAGLAASGLLVGLLGSVGTAFADDITIRIATGHPPGVVYAGLMKDYFEPELKKRVEERTDHTINFVEGYSGSIVKVAETFEGVRTSSCTPSRGCCRSGRWIRPSALKSHRTFMPRFRT